MLIQYITELNASKRIILASASPRRRDLLKGLGLKYEAISSTFDELLDKSLFADGAAYAVETATHKAIEVTSRCIQDRSVRHPDLVIGADTVVEQYGVVIEKPFDEADALRILRNLSGTRHEVHTGVVLILPHVVDPKLGKAPMIRSFFETTEVDFADIDDEALHAYVASGEPMDKSGAYGIQGLGGCFVKKIEGCFFNVMGLPLHRFTAEVEALIKEGFLPLPERQMEQVPVGNGVA